MYGYEGRGWRGEKREEEEERGVGEEEREGTKVKREEEEAEGDERRGGWSDIQEISMTSRGGGGEGGEELELMGLELRFRIKEEYG